MKRILVLLTIVFAISCLILPLGCAKSEEASYHIDREITGQLIAIDKGNNEFSILSFSNGISIKVTTASLDQWEISGGFHNNWTYQLQQERGFTYYKLVDIQYNWRTDAIPIKKGREVKE